MILFIIHFVFIYTFFTVFFIDFALILFNLNLKNVFAKFFRQPVSYNLLCLARIFIHNNLSNVYFSTCFTILSSILLLLCGTTTKGTYLKKAAM